MRRGALVLCGGHSTRMGRDKATIPFGAETLLERVVRRIAPAVDEIVVVARPGQDLPPLPPGARVARDTVRDRGPLGGLEAGLSAATSEALYATACDVPFLRPEVVDLLFARLGAADVAVAEAQGRLHPLAAVYRAGVLPEVRALLGAERLRPVFLYERVATVRVKEGSLRRVDPDLECLRNCNDPAALEAALARRPLVRVELYEVARRLAGTDAVDVEATTLGEALGELARRHPALQGPVIDGRRPARHWRTSVDGRRFVEDPSLPLAPGDRVLLLSAMAGG